MFIAKVVGNVWATRKHPDLDNLKLLIVRPVNEKGEFRGEAKMAVDGGVGAGPGDTVLVVDEGGSARGVLKRGNAPVRTLVCAVIDKISGGFRA